MSTHADLTSTVVEPNDPEGNKTDDRRIVFIVSLHVKPGREVEFLRLLTPVLDAMRHETTFINAALHRDPTDPTRFMLYETWADLDDVTQVQLQREYRQAYLAPGAPAGNPARAAPGPVLAAAAQRLHLLRGPGRMMTMVRGYSFSRRRCSSRNAGS
jgi:quinol monooxygenase YgiN